MLDKYKLVHRDTGEIARYGDDNTTVVGGPWGAHDEQGKPYYIWVDNIPEPSSLDELKLAAWNRIKSTRDTLEQSGVPYVGGILDSDPISVQRITIAVQAAQAAISAGMDFSLSWTMQDNSVLPMTATEVCGMPVALAMYSNHLHEIARGLRDLIEVAQSAKELDSIMWPEV